MRFQALQESRAQRPVDQSMIKGQGNIHHWTNGDGIIDDNRPFFQAADTKNGNLRLIDQRKTYLRTKNAEI